MNGRLTRCLKHPLWLLILLAFGMALSVSRGQDAAWDLKNYHLYNAWAFLHGRLGTDIAAAGLQSYFNPLPDLPYFWLGSGLLASAPRVLAAYQGIWFGALAFVLLRIALRYDEQAGRSPGWQTVAAVGIGITGSMTWSQAGLSTNEVPLALLVLCGYFVAMPVAPGIDDLHARHGRRVVIAGLLCGLAAGLKPTAIVYSPALAFAVWAATGFRLRGLRLAAGLGVAAFVGFVIAYGAWGVALDRLTGNPIFPMFNQVFHSPWMPADSATDRQFMPRSIMQALFYPFWWLRSNDTQGGNTFADARYALAMLALAVCALVAFVRRREAPLIANNAFLFSFVGIAYLLWLALYSILRYAVPVEALTGLVVVTAVRAVATLGPALQSERRQSGLALSLLLVIVGTTRYTDWGHAPFGEKAFDIDPGPLAEHSMVLVISGPHAYLAPFVEHADTARFVGVTWLNAKAKGFGLDQRIRQAVTSHRGPLYLIVRDDGQADLNRLRDYLPGFATAACRPVRSQIEQTRRGRNIADGLRLCRVTADVSER